MEWKPAQIKEFGEALLAAFRSDADLRRMVRFGEGLGQNIDVIAGGSNLQVRVDNLTDWADQNTQLDVLLAAAVAANPNNARLKAFATKMANPSATSATDAGNSSTGSSSGGTSSPTLPIISPTITSPSITGPPETRDLAPDDRDTVGAVLTDVFTNYLFNVATRPDWLKNAGVPSKVIANLNALGAGPSSAARELLNRALSLDVPIDQKKPGYTVLGILLDQILADQYVSQDQGRYLTEVIRRYNLIRPAAVTDGPSDKLKTWLADVPLDDKAEAFVRDRVGLNRFLDVVWLQQAVNACRAVCRVETPKQFGTGFLLADNLVITNYHVMQEVIADPTLAAGVELRFGFARRADGSVDKGTVYKLDSAWLVDSSPNTAAGLDYALLRVSGTPGTDMVGTLPRGSLLPQLHTFRQGEDLFIVQHPSLGGMETEPQKIVLAPNAVAVESADHKRVTYAVNTEHGSSGSPCFTSNWELVALHHSRFDKTNNEGIPFNAILQQSSLKTALQLP